MIEVREAASVGLAQRLAEAVGTAAWRLGIRGSPGPITSAIRRLVDEPATLYSAYPAWPSRMTDGGLPVELSLRLGRNGDCAYRCVADVTDHRVAPAENWTRFLSYASQVVEGTGMETAAVRALCERHLNGVPTNLAGRIIHGLGFGTGEWYRGSLYFRTSWMPPDQLRQRLPKETAVLAEAAREYGAPVDGEVEVVGYDFAPGCPARWKAYSWPDGPADASFHKLVGRHPDLEPAREVFEAFCSARRPGHPRPLLLQTTADGGRVGQRLFFFGSAWGWTSPALLDRLMRVLEDRFAIDVAKLGVVADAAHQRELKVRIAMLAVGAEDGEPSGTFYLWPG